MTQCRKLILVAGLIWAAVGCEQNNNSGQSALAALPGTESMQEFGDFELHFNAIMTDRLNADMASEYGIVRSKNSALLTVSVLRKQEGGTPTAVPADVEAAANNLTGQLKDLAIREITEGDAIYYIAQTPVANSETLVFTVNAMVEGEAEPLTVRFQKQFFEEE